MVWSLLLLTFVIAQDKPAGAAADKPVPAVAAETDGPPLKAATKGAGKAAAPAPANPPAAESPFSNIYIMFIPAILIFWMMFARPQRKQEAKLKELLNNLKKNDKVLTSAGIYGTVISTDAATDRVVVRVDDDKGVKLTFSKASIVRVIEPQPDKAADSSS